LFSRINVNNPNTAIIWLAQILLLVAITQAGFVFYLYDRFYRWVVFSGCVVIGYLVSPKDSAIRNISLYEMVLIFFIGFIFLSHFWAENPALIWNRGFHWIFLLCLFKVFYTIDLTAYNLKFWSYAMIIIVLCNLVFIASTYIEASQNYDHLSIIKFYDSSVNQIKYSIKGNYVTSILLLQLLLLMMIDKLYPINKILKMIIMLCVTIIILLFRARGSSIAFMILCFMLIYIKFYQHRKKLNVILVLLPLIYLGFFRLFGKSNLLISSFNPLRSMENNGNDERLNLWVGTLRLIKEEWLHGVGAGNWISSHGRYGFHEYFGYKSVKASHNHAHNLFLEYFSELGIIGIATLIFIFAYPIFLKPKSKSNAPVFHLAKAFILLYIVLSLFYGIVYDIRFEFRPQLIFLILIISYLVKFSDAKVFSVPSIANKYILLYLFIMFSVWLNYRNDIHKKEILYEKLTRKNARTQKRIKVLNQIYDPKHNTNYKGHSIQYLIGSIRAKKIETNQFAIEGIKQAIREFPYQFHYWYKLGELYKKINNYEEALNSYTKALEINKYHIKSILAFIELSMKMPNSNDERIKEYLSNYEDCQISRMGKKQIERILSKDPRTTDISTDISTDIHLYYRMKNEFESKINAN